MSERYGNCKLCRGRGEIQIYDQILLRSKNSECPRCDGTGCDSSSSTHMDQEQSIEEETHPFDHDTY